MGRGEGATPRGSKRRRCDARGRAGTRVSRRGLGGGAVGALAYAARLQRRAASFQGRGGAQVWEGAAHKKTPGAQERRAF
ncbi:hypothetical protein FRC98_15795 [Lujinxingia vulgaris]|uniref:Uncharacterized protein n=1 Tax=Lujinxingia vulgaris TaxID=2600176 RepID=A0A5C6X7G6_9DELT|nr:hypothetical protein FRC98_15795 [Lujinxingia vulgaris]